MTTALSHIQNMSPYALANVAAPVGRRLISLSQNESLRPPSPDVIQAATAALVKGAEYPDPDWTDLRASLAALHDIPAQGILCGAGSLDLIGCLMRVYSGPERSVLAPEHAYPFFKTAAQMADARLDTASEVDATVDVDALLGAVQPDTGIVCVANPGNPTGTRITTSDIRRLRAGLRDDILLVIDEAYGEFADHLDGRCWDMVEAGNCVVLRTFSKAYSMAGFRIGWGLFPEPVAEQVRKVMNPNNLSRAAQMAAVAAVRDQAYMEETCAMTRALRENASRTLIRAGIDVVPSVTNFVLIQFASPDEAQAADAALRADGIVLRRQQGAGLPHALRMTIGQERATHQAVTRLIQWRQETKR